MDGIDGTATAGRKGIAYDWRNIVRAAEFDLPHDEIDERDSWLTDEALARFASPEVAR